MMVQILVRQLFIFLFLLIFLWYLCETMWISYRWHFFVWVVTFLFVILRFSMIVFIFLMCSKLCNVFSYFQFVFNRLESILGNATLLQIYRNLWPLLFLFMLCWKFSHNDVLTPNRCSKRTIACSYSEMGWWADTCRTHSSWGAGSNISMHVSWGTR